MRHQLKHLCGQMTFHVVSPLPEVPTGNQRLLKEKGSFSSREKRFSLWPMLLTPLDSWIWFLDSSLEILDTGVKPFYFFSIQWSLEIFLSLLYFVLYPWHTFLLLLCITAQIIFIMVCNCFIDFSFLEFLHDAFSKSEFPC